MSTGVSVAGHEGVKGGLFVIDILFTNGHIIQLDLVEGDVPIWKLKRDYTKVSFCSKWCDQIVASASPLRRRRTGTMVLADVSQGTLNSFLSPLVSQSRSSSGGTSEGDMQAHQLVDWGKLARAAASEASGGDRRLKVNKRKRGSSHGGSRQKCAYKACNKEHPKRSQLRCVGCMKFFHLECFFQTHVAACHSQDAVVGVHSTPLPSPQALDLI